MRKPLLTKSEWLWVEENPPPFEGIVWIPADEMPERTFELPSPKSKLRILDSRQAGGVISFLNSVGRTATLEPAPFHLPLGPVRLWEPNVFLFKQIDELKSGTALDLGCGSGRNAVALAATGWQVVALDHLPEALTMGKKLQGRYAPETSIEWVQERLTQTTSFQNKFDLVITTMIWEPWFESLVEQVLRPGGTWIFESYSRTNHHRFGKPKHEEQSIDPLCIFQTWTHLSSPEEIKRDERWLVQGHLSKP